MALNEKQLKLLDNFAPFGCGLGIISTPVWAILFHPSGISWLVGMSPVLSYLLCTCTHRKYLLFSSAALFGTIGGGAMGFLISAPLSYFFGYNDPDSGWMFLALFCFIFAFYFSRRRCNYLKKKDEQ
jgi:predicted membrane protein